LGKRGEWNRLWLSNAIFQCRVRGISGLLGKTMSQTTPDIPEELISFFSTVSCPIDWVITDILGQPTHPVYNLVRSLVRACGDTNLAGWFVTEEISRRRLKLLRQEDSILPKPYQHKDLSGIGVEKGLVKISDFDIHQEAFERGKTVFQILPTLPALNSMHWAKQKIFSLSSQCNVLVRLDPFMMEDRDAYRGPMFKMWIYGPQLDWNDIATLKEDRHCRMKPDSGMRRDVEFTDMVWSPRGDGIHFRCEEVPVLSDADVRGSRYLHAIYTPETETFTHADGAIRIFTSEELKERTSLHVRNAGKVGFRVKAFEVNGQIQRDEWSELVGTFFVWNDDVNGYFNLE
jgi:hypothetical protein